MNDEAQKKLSKFFSSYKLQKYKKGEILLRADENPQNIFYLIKGSVKQYSISKNGDEQLLNVFKPGAFFPMMWAISAIPNTYFFEAVGEAELYKAPVDNVKDLLKNDPEILMDLLSRMFRGTNALLQRIELFISGTAYEKVVYTILNASQRFGTQLKTELSAKGESGNLTKMTLRISHKDISSYTGLTRETVSRVSQLLQKKGLIENKNHTILIHDIKKLANELG